MTKLVLVSHALCPYVQRAAISLVEKGVAFDRRDVDLANKPDWFLEISPLGKTPVLTVAGEAIFESSAILEYLEDTLAPSLHPDDPVLKARHRGWIEVGSAVLNDIAGLYGAKDRQGFDAKAAALKAKFARVEAALGEGPYFSGADFSLVDAVFAPAFRYFDTFDHIGDFGILADLPKTMAWRKALGRRPSVIAAIDSGYPQRLHDFLLRRNSFISELISEQSLRV
ncbi:glutathione S-transferase family protein [Hwanghaeella grinnelliae]|uniref:glutathione transferase n=1 Tax=Hwanghaeella grinnelliae TaxID=2500179 RepID=A0A3S2VKB7_9PROT|nr:glutathione S-transferase family protein [Hwanghaeella grinnelliae]RVU33884.1 glutathione S-transferase family protein [Hwanghaeella grinnelliae]